MLQRTWAILVAEKHADSEPRYSAAIRDRDTRQLLTRARSVASLDRTCAVIAEGYEEDWKALAESLAPLNSFVHPAAYPLLQGVARCLTLVSQHDGNAIVVLIPADHCAAVESSWISSANKALQFCEAQPNTICILHDKPQNDPRTSGNYPGVCSSSVIVGGVGSLLDLCAGKRSTSIVDIFVSEQSMPAEPPVTADTSILPLCIVHVTSAEEYARLQRGDYGRRAAAQVDVHV